MKKFLFWLPRILAILFIIFLTSFSLDVFGMGYGFWQSIAGFLIHSIPSLFLIVLLIVAWRRPRLGGFIFLIFGILFVIWYLIMMRGPKGMVIIWMLTLSAPIFLIGVLFLVQNKFLKKN